MSLIKTLESQIRCKAKQHSDAAQFYQRCNLAMNIVSITIGGVSGLIGSIFTKSTQVYVFLVVVHWLVTILTTSNHVFKFSVKEHNQYSYARQYSNLSDELDLVIIDPENNNISKIEDDFKDINLQEPELPLCYCCKK